MVSENVPNEQTTLMSNPCFQTQPKIGTIIYKYVTEADQLLAQLQSGEVDMLDPIVPNLGQFSTLGDLEKQGKITAQYVPATVWEHIDFGMQRADGQPSFFDDVNVRHAFTYGINRQEIIVLGLIIRSSLAAPLIAPYDPNRIDLDVKDAPPSAEHLMGTDYNGRDVFSRILYAGRVLLGIAFSVVFLTSIIGTMLGVLSGYFGGLIDALIMRAVDFLLTQPLLISIFSPSISLLIIVLVFTSWTDTARLVCGQILSLREQQFVESPRVLGASQSRLIFRHLVPNTLAPIIVSVTLLISDIVIVEAVLSYLGYGVQPPDASWGNMVQNVSLTVLDK